MGIIKYGQLQVLLVLLAAGLTSAIYCGDDDCYDLLGLTQSANQSDVKKAYYKLSLKHHPDKNPDDPTAELTFSKIATAYEILYDAEKREQYDYALAHPEQYLYNTARYYQAYYVPKTDTRAILLGLLVLLSAFQYLNDWLRYNQAVEHAKQTPLYKNKLKALELERSGGYLIIGGGVHDGSGRVDSSEDLRQEVEVELHIHGAEKPCLWRLLGVQLSLLPFTCAKLLLWQAHWAYLYRWQRKPYSWEDAAYMTRTTLGMSASRWRGMDEAQRENLVPRRLWLGNNLEEYREEVRKDSRRRR
eukprot:jgi/Mesen1/9364/ME000061S08804